MATAPPPSPATPRRGRRARRGVLPGFGLSMGLLWTWLGLLVLLPLGALVVEAAALDPADLWAQATTQRALAALWLSLRTSLYAALLDTLFGVVVAWVLVRYRFPGRAVLDALVDLPFALPTAVAGIALTATFAPTGWLGGPLHDLGIDAAYSPLGIVLALTFIGLPFVVRTVQPVLEQLDPELEEAAATLGASRWHTFTRVLLPQLRPALVTGFALAFARALGEYGSVVFISGNMPGRTEIAPLLIMTRLEQFDYAGATALALVMLGASLLVLAFVNGLQWRSARRLPGATATVTAGGGP